MMEAGDLDRRITFQRSQDTSDEFNEPVEIWTNLISVWARRRDASDGEKVGAGQVGSTLMSRFVIRSSEQTRDVKPTDRIQHDGHLWNIQGIKEADEGRRCFFGDHCNTGRRYMTKSRVTVDGLQDLDKALSALPQAVGKRVARSALKEAAEPLARAARQLAPRDEYNLYESIDVSTRLSRRQRSLHRQETSRSFQEMFVGTNNPAGVQQEFGNERHRAQPFMRPAWDAEKNANVNADLEFSLVPNSKSSAALGSQEIGDGMEELLTSLLAPVAGGRRYWVRAPQKAARPYVLLQRASRSPSYHMQGSSGLSSIRVQIDVYADKYSEATTVARMINNFLSGYSSGIIQGIFVESERDLPAADAGDVNSLFRISIDIIIHHGESP